MNDRHRVSLNDQQGTACELVLVLLKTYILIRHCDCFSIVEGSVMCAATDPCGWRHSHSTFLSESFDLCRLRYDVTPVHVVGTTNGSPAARVVPDVVDEPAGD